MGQSSASAFSRVLLSLFSVVAIAF